MKKRYLGLGIAIVSLSLVSTVVSTTAWFYGASYLEVNGFNITLHDKNISISDNGIEFTDFIGASDDDKLYEFAPVSSMFSKTWLDLKDTVPRFKNGYDGAAKAIMGAEEDVSVAHSGFYSHEFFIKSDSDVYVTINSEETSFLGDEEYNKEHYMDAKNNNPLLLGLTDEEIIQCLNDVRKSLRMSILVLNDMDATEEDPNYLKDYAYYIIDPYKESDTYLGGLLDSDEDTYWDYIYDSYNNRTVETLFGELYNTDKLIYDPACVEESPLEGKNTCFNARTKKDIIHPNLEESFANGFEIAKENSLSLKEAENKMLIPINKESPKRMIISFYLEGWDIDNTNFARYAGFIIKLCFMIARTR